MFRGRHSRAAAPVRRAVAEALEERKLLTTLSAKDGVPATFDYYDAHKNTFEIELVGNITAEFIGARVRGANNTVVIRDLVSPPPPGTSVAVDGVDLFSIYVASADPDAQIIITQLTISTTGEIKPTPFGTNSSTIRFNNARTGKTAVQGLGGAGQAYIGARTVAITGQDNSDSIPITFSPYHAALGVRPSTHGIYAGLQTAPGVSLGKVLIDGTVTGIVNVAGNLGTWYSGNVLTGTATGTDEISPSSLRNNFQVGGDLRNLLVQGSVGTLSGALYRTGSEIRVGGKLGYQLVGGDFNASLSVINSGAIPGLTTPVQEIETTLVPNDTAGDEFVLGNLSGDFFSNTTYSGTSTTANQYSAAQFTSSYTSSTTGGDQTEEFQGALDGQANRDLEDNYGVPLLAGQKIGVYLNAQQLANLAIFDPLGRLVATDLANIAGTGSNTPFQFTAKLPGVYRFAVGLPSDPNLNVGASQVTVAVAYATTYTLNLSNLGNTALGGSEVSGTTTFEQTNTGLSVRKGDLGAWVSGGDFDAALGSNIAVNRGNLRALYAANIGATVNSIDLWPDLLVPGGTVGNLLSVGNIIINSSAQNIDGDPDEKFAIGGDYQRVEAGTNMNGNLVANGSIGTVIATTIASSTIAQLPVISANTAGGRNAGTIDMLYTTKDFGSALNGGPGLYTGLGGNVKYIHVGGVTFRDRYFGNALNANITYLPGQSVNLVDDSGARAIATPTSVISTTTSTGTGTGTTTTGTTAVSTPGTLSAILYGVRDAGGFVIIDLSSNTGLTVSGLNTGGSIDIGHVGIGGTGTVATYDPNSRTFGYSNAGTTTTTGTTSLPTTPDQTNTVAFTGRTPINVLGIDNVTTIGSVITTGATGNFTSVTNNTPGELATINANSIGTLTAQSIGTIASDTATAVVIPSTFAATDISFPYDKYSTGVDASGTILSLSARDGIGNVRSGAAIGTITANADGKNAGRVFDGITGDIVANVMQTVRIGEGIPDAGTGAMPTAGLFATGIIPAGVAEIDNIVGNNADIRGVIASTGVIGAIRLTNGSLIGAEILTPTDISQSAYANRSFLLSEATVTETLTTSSSTTTGSGTTTGSTSSIITIYPNSLGSIHTVGNGGIIGSFINVGDFAAIDVDGGFGILTSEIEAQGVSQGNGSVSTDGFGIQSSTIGAGTSINTISARGTGRVLSVASYSASVRQSDKSKFDAFTGRQLDATNDLNRYFRTSKATPAISGVTNGGLIYNDTLTGNNNLGTLEAYVILGGTTGNLVSANSARFPMRVSFANTINVIKAAAAISGLQVRSGKLNTLTSGGNMDSVAVTVAGAIGTVAAGRTMRGSVTITAKGPEGTIGTVYAKQGLYATITSDKGIKAITASAYGGNTQTSKGINTITIAGNILGSGYIRAQDAIDQLYVGGSILSGAVVQASTIGIEHVGGVISGTVIKTA